MAKKNSTDGSLEPQKSSAAQFLTYIASVGESNEKFELRYEEGAPRYLCSHPVTRMKISG